MPTPEFLKNAQTLLPLYRALERRILSAFPDAEARSFKTQVTFHAGRGFCFLSNPRVREGTLTLSIGLAYRPDSPRVHQAANPYGNRWTIHIRISSENEIDEELTEWLREAHDFAQAP